MGSIALGQGCERKVKGDVEEDGDERPVVNLMLPWRLGIPTIEHLANCSLDFLRAKNPLWKLQWNPPHCLESRQKKPDEERDGKRVEVAEEGVKELEE